MLSSQSNSRLCCVLNLVFASRILPRVKYFPEIFFTSGEDAR